MPTAGAMHGERAIVLGASMGGLLAARALAESFEEVVLLERDTFPAEATHRKGVPQSRHTHVLLPRGRAVLEDFFPGLTDELAALGAPLATPSQGRRFIEGGYHCAFELPTRGAFVSRPLLERQVRARVLGRRNVRALEGVHVRGLLGTPDGARVTGARFARQDADGAPEETLDATLVVDATGRGSHAGAWLQTLDYAPPEEERVEIGLGYASRHYRREPGQMRGNLYAMVTPTEANLRAAAMFAQEGDRWIVTLIGYRGDLPPVDPDGFVDFARGLAAPDIHEVLAAAEPIDDPVPARFPANLRRRYERLARFPEGFLVFGDAICSFNPMYGQGMSVSALQALALRDTLAAARAGLAPRFFRAAARAVDTPWLLTVGNDRRLTQPDAPRAASDRVLQWYMARLHLAARRDPVASCAFFRVTGLMDPPAAMLRPRVAAHVLWGSRAAASPPRPQPIA